MGFQSVGSSVMFNWSEESVEISLESLAGGGCPELYLMWVPNVKRPHEESADGS